MVPTKSKTPITASSPAAPTGGDAEIAAERDPVRLDQAVGATARRRRTCANSTQKTGVRAASRSARERRSSSVDQLPARRRGAAAIAVAAVGRAARGRTAGRASAAATSDEAAASSDADHERQRRAPAELSVSAARAAGRQLAGRRCSPSAGRPPARGACRTSASRPSRRAPARSCPVPTPTTTPHSSEQLPELASCNSEPTMPADDQRQRRRSPPRACRSGS